jgi:hypothetical protein
MNDHTSDSNKTNENAATTANNTNSDSPRDGVLIDVSETARRAGIRHPVAVTAAVHAMCAPPSESGKISELLGDMLWVLHRVLARRIPSLVDPFETHTVYHFDFYGIRRGRKDPDLICLKAIVRPKTEEKNVVNILLARENEKLNFGRVQ